MDEGLSEELWTKLEECVTDLSKANTVRELQAIKLLDAVYSKRREVIKTISKFWPTVFDEHEELEPFLQYRDDLHALSHLTDFWLARDPNEPRAFTAEFHFSENPYFSDAVLKKEYRYAPKQDYGSAEQDTEGVSEAMYDFDWEKHVAPQAVKINWKSDDKNLTKLNPRKVEEDDGEDILDPGSFFNFFEHPNDPHNFGELFETDLFPDAIDYYLGKGPNARGNAAGSDEEIDSEADDSDAEEIDLERPKKKAKTG